MSDGPTDPDARRDAHDPALEAELGIRGVSGEAPEESRARTPHGPLQRTFHWIGLGELFVGASLVALIMVLVLIQVAQRYLPGGGWVWTGEIARFSLVWCTLALSGYLMAQDRHIRLEVIDYIAPPRLLAVIKRVAFLIVALICVAMTYEAYQLISERSGQVSPATRMPLTWVYIIPFAGFILTSIRAAMAVFMADRSGPAHDEGDAP